jgi:hypothetical protein
VATSILKTLYFILLFLFTFTYSESFGQTHSWIKIFNPNVTAGTGFVQNADSVYYLDGVTGGIYRLYKGYTGTGAYNSASIFQGTHYLGSYVGGNIFYTNNLLYGFYQGLTYNGSYFLTSGQFNSYNFSTSANNILANLGGTYFSNFNCLDNTAVIGDTIYTVMLNTAYAYPFSNDLVKYSFSSNTWSPNSYSGGVAIPSFDNQPGRVGQSIVTGVFNLGDTLYAVSSYGYGNLAYPLIYGEYDTTATVWKRNPTTYVWDSLKTFSHAGILLSGQTLNNSEYLLFTSNDSSNSNAGVWKFDGNTFTKLPKPPSQYRVVGFYVANDNKLWESVANSAVADSNKIYYYNGGGWDTGQVVYSSSESNNILINNITYNNNTLFLNTRILVAGTFGVGAEYTSAYDTNYYYMSVLSPSAGYYSVGDTNKVIIYKNFTASADTDKVYVSYSGTYIYKTSMVGDTVNIVFDSTSNNATIKVVDNYTGSVAYSQSFVIIPGKYLLLQSASAYSSISKQQATLNILSKNVTSVNIYMNGDTTSTFKYYLGTANLGFTSLQSAIVTVPLTNFIINPYFKVVENKDTTVYGISRVVVSETGLLAGAGGLATICYGFAYHGLGISWLNDAGCGWVNNITKYFAAVTLNVAGNGVLTANGSATAYPFPYTGMPDYRSGAASSYAPFSIASPFYYNGREFWFQTVSAIFVSYYQLWMKDLINNVSYPIATTVGASYGTAGIFTDGNVQATVSGAYMLFSTISGYPTVFDIGVLNYPPSELPLYSIAQALGAPNIYRLSFRGIYPKALISVYPPAGK